MIETKEKFNIEAESLSSAKFSLKDENLAHVFSILRNNLYSDKILAPIREYSTNASDAMIEAGKGNLPIHVTLPTVFDPVFKVRDFGKGLSEHDVFNIFSSYGASTKRNTNKLVGTLGMGSKSGFAYAPNFTVTSYHGGRKRVYEAFIDESEIGTIAKIIEEKSNEPNGLEITIAVKKDDIQEFIATARKFYMHFEPMPEFLNYSLQSEIESNKSKYDVLYNSKYGVLYKDNNYSSYNSQPNNLYVKMGNICYPVPNNAGIHNEWVNEKYQLIINVKIGEVSFTTSRESLEMKDKTINTINHYLEKIRAELGSQWQYEIDCKPSPWAAVCAYHRMNYFQKAILSKNLVWKGKKLDVTLNIGKDGAFTIFNHHKRNGQWETTCANPYEPGEKSWFILNDGGFPTSQTKTRLEAARNRLLSKGGRIFYVRTNISDTHNLINSLEFKGANYVLLSSISSNELKNVKKTFKDSERVFQWTGSSHFPYSSCWQSVEPEDKMVYVNIDCFKPVDYTWENLKNIKKNLSNLGINLKLFGLKKGQKIDDNWVSLSDYLVELATQYALSKEYVDKYVDMKLADKMNDGWFVKSVLAGSFAGLAETVECPDVKRIVSFSFESKKNEIHDSKQDIINYAKQNDRVKKVTDDIQAIVATKHNDLKDCVNRCLKKYPLLNGLGYSYYTAQPGEAKKLVDYVNIVYKYNNQKV